MTMQDIEISFAQVGGSPISDVAVMKIEEKVVLKANKRR